MTDKPQLALVETLYDTNLLDVPAKLRELAQEIEAGRYGVILNCSVAVLGDRLLVFGFGPDSAFTASASVLQAAANKLIRDIEEHGT